MTPSDGTPQAWMTSDAVVMSAKGPVILIRKETTPDDIRLMKAFVDANRAVTTAVPAAALAALEEDDSPASWKKVVKKYAEMLIELKPESASTKFTSTPRGSTVPDSRSVADAASGSCGSSGRCRPSRHANHDSMITC